MLSGSIGTEIGQFTGLRKYFPKRGICFISLLARSDLLSTPDRLEIFENSIGGSLPSEIGATALGKCLVLNFF